MTIKLTPQQAKFRQSNAPFRGFVGGRGAGKSWVGAYDLLVRASMKKGLYGCYAPTYDMVEQASMRTLLDIGRGLGIVTDVNRSRLTVRLSNGSEILCRSLDDPEHARGPNLSGAWLDEASLMPREAFEIVIASLRQGGQQGWLSATFTPKGRSHWTYEVFGQGRGDTALYTARTRDNPFLPSEFYDTVRAQYPGHLAAQELEGEFIDIEGGLAKREWFQIVDAAPANARRVRYWDFAATLPVAGRDPDWTVGTLLAESDGIWYVLDVVRVQAGPGSVEALVRQTAALDGPDVPISMEQEPGAAGKLFTAAMIKALASYAARAEPASGDKATRAMPWLAQAEAGNVKLVRGSWCAAWLDEVTAFPSGSHDDQVDSMSGAYAALTRSTPLTEGELLEVLRAWR